jgi:CRP/FNR family transcriptional regulator, cyclic AMP receptor protein
MATSVSADTAPIWQQLSAVPMLAVLPGATLESLWQRSAGYHTAAGDVLYRQGEPATHLVVLLSGAVTARIDTAAGRVVAIGSWTAPAALDKVALLDGRRHTATLHARTDCYWRAIARADIEALITDVPLVRRHVLHVLAQQVTTTQQRFVAAATLPADARLSRWLLERAATEGTELTLDSSQEDIARHLGVTRVTLNRALRSLVKDELIRVRHARVTLIAPEALAKRATGVARSQLH